MRQVEIGGYKRVSKRTARRIYEGGGVIHLLPCKMRPDNMWESPMPISTEKNELSFDQQIRWFEFYDCQYNECGRYAAFYIREEDE